MLPVHDKLPCSLICQRANCWRAFDCSWRKRASKQSDSAILQAQADPTSVLRFHRSIRTEPEVQSCSKDETHWTTHKKLEAQIFYWNQQRKHAQQEFKKWWRSKERSRSTSSCCWASNKVRKTGEQRFSDTTSSHDDTLQGLNARYLKSTSKFQRTRFHLEFHASCNVNQQIENPSSSPSTEKKKKYHQRSSNDSSVKWSRECFQSPRQRVAARSAKWLCCSPDPRRHNAGSRADSKLGRRCSSRSCRSCSTAWDKALRINIPINNHIANQRSGDKSPKSLKKT